MRERQRRGEISDLTKPENQTPRYRELDKQFDQLVQKQRQVQIKDHLSQIYTKNGAEGLNAGTSEDWTIYMVRLPANRFTATSSGTANFSTTDNGRACWARSSSSACA